MSKYDLEHIARQLEDSPTSKILRQMQDFPTSKILRQIQDSPTSKILRQIQDSPTSKILRQMQDSPTSKILRQMQDSPNNKIISEFRESSSFLRNKIFHDSSLQKLFDNTQKDFNNFWKKNSTQLYLEELINSHRDLTSITANISATFIDDFNHTKESDAFATEEYSTNDESIEQPSTIGTNNKILNFILYSMLLTIILNNISNYIYEFYVQPIAKEYHSPNTSKEVCKYIQANTQLDKNLLTPYRVTSKTLSLYINPNLKSETLENMDPFTLVQKIDEPNLHKSWLKVRVEINNEILEGYILRRYTSPIK